MLQNYASNFLRWRWMKNQQKKQAKFRSFLFIRNTKKKKKTFFVSRWYCNCNLVQITIIQAVRKFPNPPCAITCQETGERNGISSHFVDFVGLAQNVETRHIDFSECPRCDVCVREKGSKIIYQNDEGKKINRSEKNSRNSIWNRFPLDWIKSAFLTPSVGSISNARNVPKTRACVSQIFFSKLGSQKIVEKKK